MKALFTRYETFAIVQIPVQVKDYGIIN